MRIDVSIGLLFQDDHLLLGRRKSDRKFPHKWEFPGGKLNIWEDHIDALHRELKEELEIEICDQVFLLETINSFHSWVLRFYLIENWLGFPQLKDHSALAWVHINDIHTYDLINENVIEAVGALRKHKGI